MRYPARLALWRRPARPSSSIPHPALGVGLLRRRAGAAGAWVVGPTGLLNLADRPEGMRVIVRNKRPGAQLLFTDLGGHRFTCFPPTPGAGSSLTLSCGTTACPAARARIPRRQAHPAAQPGPCTLLTEQIWCELVTMACELNCLDADARPRQPRLHPGTQAPAAARLRSIRGRRIRSASVADADLGRLLHPPRASLCP